MSFEAPAACTLPTAEQPLRVAEFAALFATALRSQERVDARHLRMTLVGNDGLTETVRDLAARETGCCSFFDFTITPGNGGIVVLDIAVPAVHTEVLDGLSDLATTAAPTSAR